MSKELKDIITELKLTAIYEEAEEGGYIGYIAELPGANTQGETLNETHDNLCDAAAMILAAREQSCGRGFGRRWPR